MPKQQNKNSRNLMMDIDEKVEIVYRHHTTMTDYSAVSRDYGTEHLLTQVDAHALLYIFQDEGMTATRLAEITNRTKGTVSLIVNHLEEEGLIYREVNPDNKREYRLYVTESGKDLCIKHQFFDRQRTVGVITRTLQQCTPEELDAFYKILQLRIEIYSELIAEDKQALAEHKKRFKQNPTG